MNLLLLNRNILMWPESIYSVVRSRTLLGMRLFGFLPLPFFQLNTALAVFSGAAFNFWKIEYWHYTNYRESRWANIICIDGVAGVVYDIWVQIFKTQAVSQRGFHAIVYLFWEFRDQLLIFDRGVGNETNSLIFTSYRTRYHSLTISTLSAIGSNRVVVVWRLIRFYESFPHNTPNGKTVVIIRPHSTYRGWPRCLRQRVWQQLRASRIYGSGVLRESISRLTCIFL